MYFALSEAKKTMALATSSGSPGFRKAVRLASLSLISGGMSWKDSELIIPGQTPLQLIPCLAPSKACIFVNNYDQIGPKMIVSLPSGSVKGKAFIFIPTLIFFTSTLGIHPIIFNPPSTSIIPIGQGSN